MRGDPSDWDRPSRRSRNQPAILGYSRLVRAFVFCISVSVSVCICMCLTLCISIKLGESAASQALFLAFDGKTIFRGVLSLIFVSFEGSCHKSSLLWPAPVVNFD